MFILQVIKKKRKGDFQELRLGVLSYKCSSALDIYIYLLSVFSWDFQALYSVYLGATWTKSHNQVRYYKKESIFF